MPRGPQDLVDAQTLKPRSQILDAHYLVSGTPSLISLSSLEISTTLHDAFSPYAWGVDVDVDVLDVEGR